MSKAGNYIVAAAYFVAGYYTGNPGFIQMGYAVLASSLIAEDRQRKARNRARDAYNASLQDRMVMLDLRPDAPRTIALGRVRAVEGVRRRWASGTNNEKLTLIVSFAGHEIDGFETFWFNDVPLELDGDGYVTTAPFTKFDLETHTLTGTLDGSGNASVTLTSTPVSGTVTAIYSIGIGDANTQGTATITLDTGLDYDISGAPAGADYTVTWQTNVGTPLARIRPYLGTDAQNVGDDLAAEYTGSGLTDTDAFAGIALAVIDLWYSDDAYPQGIPNITATFRGAKCLDPRDASTAWTENPALHAYRYARLANGWNVPEAEIRSQDFEGAADFCDASTLFTLGADDVTLERYRCGIVLSTDADPRQNMNAIMETMAGRWGWAGGTLRMRCGRMATPTWSMDESWIAQQVGNGGQSSSQPVVRITNGVPREEKVNHVAGTCVDPEQRYQALPYPAVRDEVLIASDGAEYRLDMDQPGVNHIAHAQHLASITIREGQAPLRMEVTSNLSAYRCELFDVGEVTLARYGMTDKTFEVIGWRWRPTEGVMLRLSEITDAIFEPVDTLNGRDPAPNGNLPSPWDVAQIVGVAVDAGADIQPDGTALSITTVTWTAPTSQAVLVGGRIEVQVCRADNVPAAGVDWGSWIEQGGATEAVIPGLLADIFYLFRVRAINSLGVRGKWSAQVRHQISGDDVPPEDVANLDWAIKPGLVQITCDPCVAADYAATELRYLETVPDYDSGDWAASTFLVRGASNEYHHPRPPNGTYYVLAKHKDTSGNYSVNPAYITVVVDDSIDFGLGGTLRLSTSRFPVFMFATGTTHTALAPGDTDITITARLIGLVGVANFVAEAFDSSDASLGTFALGGTGNARTISAAQFVSLGTSGSVRTVVVAATLGSASDHLTIYRQDSTTTAPRLYLSNPFEAVATDEAGDFGDYSNAVTDAVVYAGVTDVTGDFTFSMTPDAGVTAAINGGAGPVTAASVVVAVYDMTNDDGAVFLSADDGVVTAPLTASFFVSKRKAPLGSAYAFYFSPRSEIRLPVDSSGAVSSYEAAWTDVKITKGGSLDDTAQWTLSKVDNGVVSTLISGRIQITSFVGLGAVTGTDTYSVPYATAGWDRPIVWIYDDLHAAYITLGHINSGTWSNVMVGPDPATFNIIGVGLAGRWNLGAYDQGAICLVESGVGSTDKVRRSTDGGQTWATGTALSSLSQWVYAGAANGRMYVSSYYSLACRSTNGGSTWSTITTPAGNLRIYGGLGRLIGAGSDDVNRQSFDHGDTWSTPTGIPFVVNHADPFRGRLWATGRYSSTNKIVYAEASGGWVTVTLPGTYTNGILVVVSDVLYLVGGTNIMYCADGATWALGSVGGAAYPPVVANGASIPSTYIPLQDYNGYAFAAHLSATSADTGFVLVTASKAGELDFVRSLPVLKGTPNSDVYTFQASPGFLLLPATADGVVTDWTSASITARANKNGADDTANWSWIWTTTNLTPASGTGATATFTAMSADAGQVTFRGSKAGQPDVTGTLDVVKAKGGIPAGPIIGAAFHVIDTTNTWIGLKFLGNGKFQVKRGSGGSYADAGQWAGAVLASNASTYWVRVSATGHSLDSGTLDTWLAMTTDREYVLSDATSGTHLTNLTVLFATSSGGANAVIGFGSLQLIVP